MSQRSTRLPDSTTEKHRLLWNDWQLAAHIRKADVTDVDAVDLNGATARFYQPVENNSKRRLPWGRNWYWNSDTRGGILSRATLTVSETDLSPSVPQCRPFLSVEWYTKLSSVPAGGCLCTSSLFRQTQSRPPGASRMEESCFSPGLEPPEIETMRQS